MDYSSAFALPSSVEAQRRYPAHDPPLPPFSDLVNRNQPEAVTNMHISNNLTEEGCNSHRPTIVLGSLHVENQLELPSSVTENHNNQDEHITGFGSLNVENQLELASVVVTENHNDQDEHITGGLALNTGSGIMNNSIEENRSLPNILRLGQSITIGDGEEEGGGVTDDDPNILGINEQQTTRLNGSNVAPYALTMVLSLLGFVFFGLKQGKHTPLHIANPFAFLAVVGSGIAYVTFSILSWINDRSDNKMLKGIYYVGCNLAFISLLFMLFTVT